MPAAAAVVDDTWYAVRTGVPRIGLPPASIRPPRRPKRKGLSPLSTIQRLVAHTADKYSNAVDRERLR